MPITGSNLGKLKLYARLAKDGAGAIVGVKILFYSLKRRKIVKLWISKYALTHGLIEVEKTSIEPNDVELCVRIVDKMDGAYDVYHKNEWHRTKAEAVVRAEQMREKAIASHRKAIDKLEKLRF